MSCTRDKVPEASVAVAAVAAVINGSGETGMVTAESDSPRVEMPPFDTHGGARWDLFQVTALTLEGSTTPSFPVG